MNRSTKLIMPYDLRFWILMFENRQQVEQRKTLRLCSRICRTTFFIQSAFIADSNTMPVISELAVSSNTLRGIRRGRGYVYLSVCARDPVYDGVSSFDYPDGYVAEGVENRISFQL